MSANENSKDNVITVVNPSIEDCIFYKKHSQVEMHNTQNTLTHPMIATTITATNYYNDVIEHPIL